MSTYLKHMGGYTYKKLKGKSFDEIQKLFDKEIKRVNTFVAMGSEVQESKEKKEEAELKKLLVIKRDEDIAIDAIPLATKLPVIIDYKLHKEGMLVHYQLIRADGSFKRYSSMIRILQGIDREDLEALWRIVKAKYGDTMPDNEFERVLWVDLKVMFEPDKRSDVWRILQGYRVTIWKAKKRRKKVERKQLKANKKKILGRKRAGKEQQKESLKKQKVEEEKESEEVDEVNKAELKKLLVIKKDEDIAIDAIPLSTKLPIFLQYNDADQGIDREDLEALWRIMKEKYGDTRSDNKFERVLWGDLKVMFEPDKRSDVWRILQGYRVTI
ncbi:hypothetical protein Tco_0833344 [Tanacetum coccineum]